MLRILVGANDEYEQFMEDAAKGKPVGWYAVKAARAGDDAAVYFYEHGFVAMGRLAEDAGRQEEAETGRIRFATTVDRISLLKTPVALDRVKRAVPDWGWPRAMTKGPTTLEGERESQLRELLEAQAEARAFVLLWNPKLWAWDGLSADISRVRRGLPVKGSWTCLSSKVRRGDRLFVLRVGTNNPGLTAAGYATAAPEPGGTSSDGRPAQTVPVSFERILDPERDLIVTREELLRVGFPASIQVPGCQLPESIVPRIEDLWNQRAGALEDAECAAYEGDVREAFVKHRHREQGLRQKKLASFRAAHAGKLFCEVPGCGLDFDMAFGELGEACADVHHLRPIGASEGKRKTTLDDLSVVCAICHRLVHAGGANRSHAEVGVLLRKAKTR